MKATMAQLKNKVIKNSECGYVLLKHNPYYANVGRISAMENAIVDMIEAGNSYPERRYTASPKQVESLQNWIDSLKEKFLN